MRVDTCIRRVTMQRWCALTAGDGQPCCCFECTHPSFQRRGRPQTARIRRACVLCAALRLAGGPLRHALVAGALEDVGGVDAEAVAARLARGKDPLRVGGHLPARQRAAEVLTRGTAHIARASAQVHARARLSAALPRQRRPSAVATGYAPSMRHARTGGGEGAKRVEKPVLIEPGAGTSCARASAQTAATHIAARRRAMLAARKNA